jgi:hypothetical protein
VTFPKEAKGGIEYQENSNDQRLSIFVEAKLDHDDEFKHPGNGRPEFPQYTADRMD